MKKIILQLAAGLLLLSGMATAQSKAPADTPAKPKTSAVGQQAAALIKAITDSLNSQTPKANAKKNVYGNLTLTPDQITLYDAGNKDKLLNPNLSTAQRADIKNNKSKLTDEQKFAYLQIDTAEITFKKNKISSIRIVSPTAGTAAFVGSIDPWSLKDKDVIAVTVQHTRGTIRVSDFLTFLWLTDVDDNLESGTKRLTAKSRSVSLTGY